MVISIKITLEGTLLDNNGNSERNIQQMKYAKTAASSLYIKHVFCWSIFSRISCFGSTS